MNIIESTRIDLISPFPVQEARRVFGWMRAYKSIIETDQSPKTPEEFASYFQGVIPGLLSYGVIDKNNVLEMKHEAPLIGMVAFEPHTIWNGYLHIASTRKAWGSGLFEEGCKVAITNIFNTLPDLTRVSAHILFHNYPARALAKRLEFKQEGVFADMVKQHNELKDIVQFGMTRRRWLNNDGLHEEHS